MQRKKKRKVFLLVLLVFILYVIPFYILVLNTFKTTQEFTITPFAWPHSLSFDNYKEAIQKMNFWNSFKNTAIITVTASILNTLIASMTGYYFSRKNYRINKIIFAAFLTSMVAPFQVYMIPLFKIFGVYLGLSNNLFLVAYVAAGLNIPFAVFLYHGFIESIPKELDEAAMIDGCSFTRTFFSIILPLLRPIVITVVVFVALGVWNDYLMSSLFLTKMETRALSIAAFTFLSNHTADYSPMMAGLVLGIIPVLTFYMLGQKYIIDGVVQGSVKG